MTRKGSILSLVVVGVLTGSIYLLFLLTPEPPVQRLEEARRAVSEARWQGAADYAPDLFAQSEKALEQALLLLNTENERFILFREYGPVDSACREVIRLAEMARNKSLSNSRQLEIALDAKIKELQQLVEHYGPWMNSLPVSEAIRRKFLNGKMSLAEASVDARAGNLNEGDLKVGKAGRSIRESAASLRQYLEDYFADYPEWASWYRESVEHSRKSRTSLIVVDKMARTCRVYKNGKLKRTYEVELGRNWIGDKRYRGDKSTPEGRYRVMKKLENGHTKYYKALLINYPNDDDQARFSRDRKNGSIPRNAEIGGLIEIHGHGGKGADWTDGCIALRDDDMRDLFSHVAVSTPVTIVGSLVPLGQILKY